jgi:hypothetical protein
MKTQYNQVRSLTEIMLQINGEIGQKDGLPAWRSRGMSHRFGEAIRGIENDTKKKHP